MSRERPQGGQAAPRRIRFRHGHPGRRCGFEIYADARHPSRVLLPVLRSVRAATG